MSENVAVLNRSWPNTVESLEVELKELGLRPGMTVLVHSSLSSLGWVSGGEVAVVQALINVVTERGTIVMPTHSTKLSEPSYWRNPPVPEQWWQEIRDSMPAFDPKVTPTWGMGQIVEVFRDLEGVCRSSHPQVSFAAWGRLAAKITENHQLDFGLGVASPLQKIYDLEGYILLLGVGHGNNTSLHLSEHHAKIRPTCLNGAPIMKNGKRIWKEFRDLETDDGDFHEIGQKFEEKFKVKTGNVGNATARLMKQKELVDFGTNWFSA